MDDFIELVSEMRRARRSYFRTRDHGDLQLSKKLEKEVDQKIQELKTPNLFNH